MTQAVKTPYGDLPPALVAAFKAYDIRGRLGDEFNAAAAYRIGLCFGELFGHGRIAVCRDMRLSGPALVDALAHGLMAGGCDVLDLGMGGTEAVYFAVADQQLAGGIVVTASHNPADYNGMKLVRRESRPISADTGLQELLAAVKDPGFPVHSAAHGITVAADFTDRYIDRLLSYIDVSGLTPLKVVANAGNGAAGPVLQRLAARLPFEFIGMQLDPDGSFPNGLPNPLLPENRQITKERLLESGANLAIAWDGDFDRCFFWDENGRFIEGYYIIGLIAERLLQDHPGARIVHDPRLYWNTEAVVRAAGGEVIASKSGHAFIKEKMREVDALYGGEMSAHHYFKSFSFCDSGMIPWLLVAALMCERGVTLSSLVDDAIRRFPCSGEINRTVRDADRLLEEIRAHHAPSAMHIDELDGLSVEYPRWRFNIRKSNTEPLVRLNVETRGDAGLLAEKTRELLAFLDHSPAGTSKSG